MFIYTICLYYTCIFLRLNLFILSVVPTPELSLNSVNPPTLSDQLILECNATAVRGITSRLDFMWIRTDDDSEMIVQNVTGANTTDDSLVYTDIYTTSMALMESDIGVVYLCMITLNTKQPPITKELNITLDTSISEYMCIPYMYNFSRDVNFADDPNLGFSRFYFRGSLAITPCTSSVLQLFYKISRI